METDGSDKDPSLLKESQPPFKSASKCELGRELANALIKDRQTLKKYPDFYGSLASSERASSFDQSGLAEPLQGLSMLDDAKDVFYLWNDLPAELKLRVLMWSISWRNLSDTLAELLLSSKSIYDLLVNEECVWKALTRVSEQWNSPWIQPGSRLTHLQEQLLTYQLLQAGPQSPDSSMTRTMELRSYRDIFCNVVYPRLLAFNGVYISKILYMRRGEPSFGMTSHASNASNASAGLRGGIYCPVHVVTYYRCFKFWPSGRVICVLTSEDPKLFVPKLAAHLRLEALLLKRAFEHDGPENGSIIPQFLGFFKRLQFFEGTFCLDSFKKFVFISYQELLPRLNPRLDKASSTQSTTILDSILKTDENHRYFLQLEPSQNPSTIKKLIWSKFEEHVVSLDEIFPLDASVIKPAIFSRVRSMPE